MSRLKTVVLLFCLVLTTAAAATAQVTGSTTLTVSRAVIYVNKDSSCPGSGTIGSPYCSIQNAFNVAAAGDDIRIQKASSPYDENAIAQSSGSSGSPIIVESDDASNQAIIRYTGNGAVAGAMEFHDRNYWTIQNLTFDGKGVFTSTMAVWIGLSNSGRWSSGPALTGFRVLNNTFRNWGGTEAQESSLSTATQSAIGTLFISGGYGAPVGSFTIDGTVVQDNLFDTDRMIAISMTSTTHSIVQNNEIKNTTCGRQTSGGPGLAVVIDGMHLITGTVGFVTGDLFKGNLIHDHQLPGSCGLAPTGDGYWEADGIHGDVYPVGGTIDSNKIWNIDPANVHNGTSTGLHIEAGNFGWTVKNNVIYNIGYAGILNNQQTGSGPVNQYYNNTIYSNGSGAGNQIGIELRWGFAVVKNNIIGVTDLPIYLRSQAITAGGITIDYNDYWNQGTGANVASWNEGAITNFATWKTNCGCDSHSINADPQFVSSSTPDFHLQATSPAINAGITLTQVTTDFDGIAQPQGSAYDMGAYDWH